MLFLFTNQEDVLAKGPSLVVKTHENKYFIMEVFVCLLVLPGDLVAQITWQLLSQGTADTKLLKHMMCTKKHKGDEKGVP